MFHSIIEWIKSWFVNKPAVVAQDDEVVNKNDHIVHVEFKIMEDGGLQNAIYWNYDSDEAAIVLGRLLYTITSGALNKELVSILEEKKENKRFSNIVMASWKQMVDQYGPLYDTTEDEDEPIVQPDQFLNNLKKSVE